jgi:branched-chain amino acid transport system ATP-binding protein
MIFKRISKKGATILLIEQNVKKALSIASKGYVLQKGEIVVQGNRDQLYGSDIIKKFYLKG